MISAIQTGVSSLARRQRVHGFCDGDARAHAAPDLSRPRGTVGRNNDPPETGCYFCTGVSWRAQIGGRSASRAAAQRSITAPCPPHNRRGASRAGRETADVAAVMQSPSTGARRSANVNGCDHAWWMLCSVGGGVSWGSCSTGGPAVRSELCAVSDVSYAGRLDRLDLREFRVSQFFEQPSAAPEQDRHD
jgi:hypothetical protein